ncbi:MAG TPA: tetratricopeptide repeat protein [Bryobacteraceae bacterium]|nr:tetratricopeptide repeat protein [Bryobacteraceae bacterium]
MFKAAWAVIAIGGLTASGQTPAASTDMSPKVDKASAYYHYTVAHMYAELAGAYGNRGNYLDKAIENYKEAIKADPATPMLTEELSELYIGSGRLREAQTDAEEALRKNPNDISAHRLLAHVFTRQIGDAQQNRVDEVMLHKTIEQYQKISELDPKDADAFVMLGRLQKVAQNSIEAQKAYKKALELDPENEDALTGLALVYQDLGDTNSATDLLKKLAEKNPTPKSLRVLAGAYEQMKEYTLAAQALQRALEMNPPDASDLKRQIAQYQTAAKQYDQALKTYQDLANDEPNEKSTYLAMSQLYREMHDFKNARQMSDKAKAIDPEDLDVRYNEVGLLEAEGKTAEALQAMKSLADSTAKRSYNQKEKGIRIELLERLAAMYKLADRTQEAVDTLKDIINLEPQVGPQMTAEIVDTYRQGKEYTKAEQEAEAAVKKWPSDRAVHIAHARVLTDMGKVDPAAAEVKKLIDSKNERELNLELAQLYDKGKKYDELAKVLDTAEKLSTSPEEKQQVWFMRGAMFEKMKKMDASEAEFRKILKVSPDSAGVLNYLGYMLADRNQRLNEALEMIQKAVDQDPNNGAYLDSLGWVYLKLGRLPEAETNLRKAIEFTPRDATVHDHLGDVLLKESKVKEAVAQWEVSLKEWNASAPADLEPDEVAKVKTKLDGAKVRLAKEGAKPDKQ